MKIPFITILALLAVVLPAYPQFDMIQPVDESGYGLVKTNLTFSYDHTFGAVPDNINGRVSYQFVNKPFLKFTANARFNTLWANFEDSRLSEPLDAWGIGLNGNHYYGSFGFTALGFLPVFGKPLAMLATGNAEWSNHCFGRISGLFGAVYLLRLNKTTQFGIGPVVLIHTASSFPVFPCIIYRHRFNKNLALNIYGGIFGLEFNPTPDDLIVFGADLDARSFYFKPHKEGWPDKCRFTMTLFRPGLKYKRRLAKNFYGEIGAGVGFKMSGRVTGATKSKRYLDFDEDPSFFLKATVSYSL
jgi:hypothetical protein